MHFLCRWTRDTLQPRKCRYCEKQLRPWTVEEDEGFRCSCMVQPSFFEGLGALYWCYDNVRIVPMLQTYLLEVKRVSVKLGNSLRRRRKLRPKPFHRRRRRRRRKARSRCQRDSFLEDVAYRGPGDPDYKEEAPLSLPPAETLDDDRERPPAEPIRRREARDVRRSGEVSQDDETWGDT